MVIYIYSGEYLVDIWAIELKEKGRGGWGDLYVIDTLCLKVIYTVRM